MLILDCTVAEILLYHEYVSGGEYEYITPEMWSANRKGKDTADTNSLYTGTLHKILSRILLSATTITTATTSSTINLYLKTLQTAIGIYINNKKKADHDHILSFMKLLGLKYH